MVLFQFVEDRIYRHLEPALAFQLEINRMRNFDLEAIPVTNHRMHMYLGRAKVSVKVKASGSRSKFTDQIQALGFKLEKNQKHNFYPDTTPQPSLRPGHLGHSRCKSALFVFRPSAAVSQDSNMESCVVVIMGGGRPPSLG